MMIDPEGLLTPPTALAKWFLVGDPEKGKLKADMIRNLRPTRLFVLGLERERLRAIVRREVVRLMELALNTDDEVLRDAAVRHAVILCRRTRTRMPRAYAKLICRRCLSLYRFSEGSRFRVRSGRGKRVVVTCGRCGALNRIPVEP